jgi:cysteinyl-tRNA synthetase
MDEDFGTPEAMAVLFDLASEVNKTRRPNWRACSRRWAGCLGLLQGDPKAFLQAGAGFDEAAIQAQIARAQPPRRQGLCRGRPHPQCLLAQGIVLKDSPAGTTWEAAQ